MNVKIVLSIFLKIFLLTIPLAGFIIWFVVIMSNIKSGVDAVPDMIIQNQWYEIIDKLRFPICLGVLLPSIFSYYCLFSFGIIKNAKNDLNFERYKLILLLITLISMFLFISILILSFMFQFVLWLLA